MINTWSACIAFPADSLNLKFTKAQYFSGNSRTLNTGPYLEGKNNEINKTV